MKLFISADIEGCAGTTLNYETHKEEPAYQKYAKQMTVMICISVFITKKGICT